MKRLLLITIICSTSISFGQVPSYVVATDLVAWWGFNGNANDESGNDYNGSVNGATLVNDRLGNMNSAYEFDGVDDDIACPNINELNGCTEFSYSFWMNKNASCQQYARLIGQSKGTGQQSFSTRIQMTGSTLQPSIRNGANTYAYGSTLSNNSWYHIVMVYDGNGVTNDDKVKLYVNNVLVDLDFPNGQNDIPTTTYTGTDAFYMGWDIAQPITNPRFGGYLDDVGIWIRVLTDCEITALYTGQDCNVGISELNPNQSKELIKIVNLLGQEVEYTPNTILIYQYSDGTSEKVFTID